jgi:hypothetical protein
MKKATTSFLRLQLITGVLTLLMGLVTVFGHYTSVYAQGQPAGENIVVKCTGAGAKIEEVLVWGKHPDGRVGDGGSPDELWVGSAQVQAYVKDVTHIYEKTVTIPNGPGTYEVDFPC